MTIKILSFKGGELIEQWEQCVAVPRVGELIDTSHELCVVREVMWWEGKSVKVYVSLYVRQPD